VDLVQAAVMVTVSQVEIGKKDSSWLKGSALACFSELSLCSARKIAVVGLASLVVLWIAASAPAAWAQPAGCIRLDDVSQWEIIDSSKVLAYDKNNKYLAFVSFSYLSPGLRPGGTVNLRFFSPSICSPDNVLVNGQSTWVRSVEIVRRN
jgi:hypothetical protein